MALFFYRGSLNGTVVIWNSVAGTALALWLSDKLGRKILLLLSGLGMAISMAVLGSSFLLTGSCDDAGPGLIRNLPLIAMSGFFFSYAIGFNSVLLVLVGELFSPGESTNAQLPRETTSQRRSEPNLGA